VADERQILFGHVAPLVTTQTVERRSVIVPHDLDAERAVLGAILLEGAAALEGVRARLAPEDFYAENHRTIFRAILRMHLGGRVADLITLTHELGQTNELSEAGGPAHLALLVEAGAVAAQLVQYVGILRELADKRALFAFSDDLGRGALNGASAASLLSRMDAMKASLSARACHSEPELVREGLDLALVWPGGLRFDLATVKVGKDGVKGDLSISLAGRLLHSAEMNLSSLAARESLVKKLREIIPTLPWREYLEQTCARLTAAARQGEPITRLTGAPSTGERHLIPKILLDGETNVWFADGDSGKSLLSLAGAIAVATGKGLPGGLRPSRQAAVMILNWETNSDSPNARLGALCAGLGMDVPENIYHRHQTGPLVRDAGMLAREVARLGVGLVIADSAAPASEDPDSAEGVVPVMNALQLFSPAARLLIAHVSKGEIDKGGIPKPYGSVFTHNLARNIWFVRRDKDYTDSLRLSMMHTKANNSRKYAPLGFQFDFACDESTITLSPVDLAAIPELTKGTSLAWRLRIALAAGAKTTAALAEELEADPDSVRKALYREKKAGRVDLLHNNEWGLAK
jgi:hypothetical protein